MRNQRKLLSVITFLLVVSFSGIANLQAEEKKEEAVAKPNEQAVVLPTHLGTTEVVSEEPIHEMFSHTEHVVKKKISCATCHPKIFERKRGAAAASGTYNHEHFNNGTSCGTCHNGKAAFATYGTGTCVRCHGSNMTPPERVVFDKPVRTVIFEHNGHVKKGLQCSSCHPKLFETRIGAAEEHPNKFTMEALYAGQYCGACHDGKKAFASNTRCTTCHIGVRGASQMNEAKTVESGKEKAKEKE